MIEITNPFQLAVKRQEKLRMAVAGPSGAGKTFTALRIALGLVGPEGKIALLDTEHRSATKYADMFRFDVVNLDPPYHPDRYVKAIEYAARFGYDAIILDSFSHAWFGTGGLLEIVDEIARKMRSPNSFAAWKTATPIQNRLIDTINAARLHVIGTLRSKMEYVLDEDEKGRKVPRKVGMAPIQRDTFEYEFDVYGELDLEHNLMITKTRCPALNRAFIPEPGEEVGATLKVWLDAGAPAEEEAGTSAEWQAGNEEPDLSPGGGVPASDVAPEVAAVGKEADDLNALLEPEEPEQQEPALNGGLAMLELEAHYNELKSAALEKWTAEDIAEIEEGIGNGAPPAQWDEAQYRAAIAALKLVLPRRTKAGAKK